MSLTPAPTPSTTTPGSVSSTTPPEILDSEQLFRARLKANDFVVEYLKQLVTLSSGTLVLTITFLKDVLKLDVMAGFLLQLSWGAFFGCILASVFAIANTTRNLDVPDKNVGKSGFRKAFLGGSENVISAARLAWILFLAAVLLLVLFAVVNLEPLSGKQPSDRTNVIEPGAAIQTVKESLPQGQEIVSIERVALQIQPNAAPTVYWGWVVTVAYREKGGGGVTVSAPARVDVIVDGWTNKVVAPPEWRR